MSCCPDGSHGYLAADGNNNGTIESVPGASPEVEFYGTGNRESATAVIIIPDVFGWNAGRTRNIADYLAQIHGYCVVPKVLQPAFEGGTDGDALPENFDFATRMAEVGPWVKALEWDGNLRARVMSMLKHTIDGGAKKIGILGFCWGGWVCAKVLADPEMPPEMSCAVSAHPSVINLEERHEGNLLELASKIKKPFLLMPAQNDPDGYRPGGDFYEALKAVQPNSEIVDFPDMKHGWVPRSDLTDAAVKRDVERAVNLTVEYFAKHF